jgi:hypothetical protein
MQQFRHVWRSLGLKISREQAAALFLRHGCDAQGLLPSEVFAAKLQVWRVAGGQQVGRGTDVGDGLGEGTVVQWQQCCCQRRTEAGCAIVVPTSILLACRLCIWAFPCNCVVGAVHCQVLDSLQLCCCALCVALSGVQGSPARLLALEPEQKVQACQNSKQHTQLTLPLVCLP